MSILSPALLAAVGLVLLASAAGHLRAPATLRLGLGSHGVLPPGTHRPVSLVLGPLEAVLGTSAVLAALTGPPAGAVLAVSLPATALFLAFSLYLRQVLVVSDGRAVPCACGLGDDPVSRSTVARAAVLAALALAGGATATDWSPWGAPVAEALVALAAALVLALATALLPAARAIPTAAIRTDPHGTLRSTR